MHPNVYMFALLLAFYGLGEAHLVDIHVRTSEEQALEDRIVKERILEASKEILDDPESSKDEKVQAIEALIEIGSYG